MSLASPALAVRLARVAAQVSVGVCLLGAPGGRAEGVSAAADPFLTMGGLEKSLEVVLPVRMAGDGAVASEGRLMLTLTRSGSGSAVLSVGAKTHRAGIRFGKEGKATIRLPSAFASRLVELSVGDFGSDSLPVLRVTVDGVEASRVRRGVAQAEAVVSARYTGAFQDTRENLENGNVFGFFAAHTDSRGSRLWVAGKLPSGKVLLHSSLLWREEGKTVAEVQVGSGSASETLDLDVTDAPVLKGELWASSRVVSGEGRVGTHRVFGLPYSEEVLSGVELRSDVFQVSAPPAVGWVWEVAGNFLAQVRGRLVTGVPQGETIGYGGVIIDRVTGLMRGVCRFPEGTGSEVGKRVRSFLGVVFRIGETDQVRLGYSRAFKGVGMTWSGLPMQLNPLSVSGGVRGVGEKLESAAMEVGGGSGDAGAAVFGSVLVLGSVFTQSNVGLVKEGTLPPLSGGLSTGAADVGAFLVKPGSLAATGTIAVSGSPVASPGSSLTLSGVGTLSGGSSVVAGMATVSGSVALRGQGTLGLGSVGGSLGATGATGVRP